MDMSTKKAIELEKRRLFLLYRQRMLEGLLDRCGSEQEFETIVAELLEIPEKLRDIRVDITIERGKRADSEQK